LTISLFPALTNKLARFHVAALVVVAGKGSPLPEDILFVQTSEAGNGKGQQSTQIAARRGEQEEWAKARRSTQGGFREHKVG
jgi:hypothetical protein